MENSKKTRYVMLDKSGKEIYHSDGYFRFILDTFLSCIFSMIGFALIGGVICGIAAIFN